MFEALILFISNCIATITHYLVILLKLLLLIMQTNFNCYYSYISFILSWLKSFTLYSKLCELFLPIIPTLKPKNIKVKDEFFLDMAKYDFSEPFFKKVEKPNSDSFFDQYDYSNLLYFYFDFIDIYFWYFFPIILYIFLIYFLHGMLGLYSAYVDYFQKNPDHVESLRGVLPALFIFYFLIFIIVALFFFFLNLYLIYILWFVFI